MKIVYHDGSELNTDIDEFSIVLKDVKVGQVFSFLNGKDDNIYIMGEGRSHIFLNGNRTYSKGSQNETETRVILYPDATLDLGEPCTNWIYE